MNNNLQTGRYDIGEKLFQIDGRNDQEKQWLVSLIDTFPIIRGHCSDNEFHRFLLGLRRLVRRQFVEYRLVSVRELLDCKDGFSVNIQSKESPEAHTQNSRQSHRRVLYGQFVCQTLRHDDQVSGVQLQDNTGAIDCKVTESIRHNLICTKDSWCILTSWRLVSNETGLNYIEVSRFSKEENDQNMKRDIRVLSTVDVSTLLRNKDILQTYRINVIGEIRCISEVIKIKEDLILLIELENSIFIIVKDKRFLHWRDLLSPQTELLFVDLLPTSLYKGSEQEKRVLVPWKNAKVLLPVMANIEVLSLSGWLKQNPSNLTLIRQTGPTPSSCPEELCTYKGEITNTDLESFGIYQLDTTVWLILSGLPYKHQYSDLHLGSTVTVYNCHMCAFKQFPKICIVCCMSSSFRVTEFSGVTPQVKSVKPSAFIRKWLWRYSVTKMMIFQFSRFLISLYNKFHTSLCSRFDWLLEKYVNCEVNLPKRDYMKEFLSTPHSCLLLGTEIHTKPMDCFLPIIPLCSDIVFDSALIQRVGYDIIQNLRTVEHLNSDLYWLYHSQDQDVTQVLIGYIQFCPDTGMVLLMDDTGCHKCLILTGRDKSELSFSALNVCLVAIQKYCIVFEKFQLCQYPNCNSYGDQSYVRGSREDHYLVVSISNIEILIKNKKSKVSTDKERVLCCVIHKESLLLDGVSSGRPHFRFTAFGYFLDTSWLEEEVHDFGNDALKFWKERYLADDVTWTYAGGDDKTRNLLSATKILLFQNASVKWYNTLQPGKHYWFSSEGGLTPVSAKSSLKFLKKAEKQAGGKTCVLVPSDLWVTERKLDYRCQQMTCHVCKNSSMLSEISEITKESFQNKMVSFEGRIKNRRHLPRVNQQYQKKTTSLSGSTSCVSTLDNRKISLTVSSLDAEDEVVVYMTLTNTCYPLGLLPGHVIRFRNLERRVSRHGSVYCQYVVVSTLEILGAGTQPLLREVKEPEMKDYQWENALTHHLCEIWRPPALSLFQCVTHIHRITKLSFKSTCLNCNSIICNGECENHLCNPDHGTKFSASASFSVDDGTSFANVKCYSGVVQKLLELSDIEWVNLEEAVKLQGDIFITSNNDNGSSVEFFLQTLRGGSHLHLPKQLLLKPDRQTMSQDVYYNLDAASSSDFPMKAVDTSCGQVETKCLPILHLTCLDIRQLDVTSYVMNNFTSSM